MKKHLLDGVEVVVTDRLDGDMSDRGRAGRLVARAGGGRLVIPKQKHTSLVVGVSEVGRGEDGVVLARGESVAVGVLTADCLPVAIWGRERLVVIHAGRRGLLAGVVEAGLARLAGEGRLRAFIGPSIRRCCYRVRLAGRNRQRAGKYYDGERLDIPGLAGQILADAGVTVVAEEKECTWCGQRYFSYRGGDESQRFLTAGWWR